MQISTSKINLFLLIVAGLMITGCSNSKVGTVSGVVTLDGKPIDQATVSFYPDEGRASLGRTNEKGEYRLTYTRGVSGAVIGNHKVTISTLVDAEVDYGDSNYESGGAGEVSVTSVTKARPESMPPKYRDRRQTVLTATVERGSNEINFELTSD